MSTTVTKTCSVKSCKRTFELNIKYEKAQYPKCETCMETDRIINGLQKQNALQKKEIEQLKKDIKIRDEQILKLTDSAFSADKWGS